VTADRSVNGKQKNSFTVKMKHYHTRKIYGKKNPDESTLAAYVIKYDRIYSVLKNSR